jgi:serine/threonine-protein kinase
MLEDINKIRAGQNISTKVARAPLVSRRTAIISGIAAIAIGAAAIIGLSLNGGSTPSLGNEIPNVVGLTETQARA